MSQSSVQTIKFYLNDYWFFFFHVCELKGVYFLFFTHKTTRNKTCLMLINNIRAETHQHSRASVWRDHSTAPEDSAGSRPDLSPAPLFLPPSFNKTLIIFPQLCFSLFCFWTPLLSPASISAWLCQERDMRWHQNPEAVEAWGFFSTVTIEMLPWLERLS